MSMGYVLTKPENVTNTPIIVGALEVHKIVLSFNKDGVSRLDFSERQQITCDGTLKMVILT